MRPKSPNACIRLEQFFLFESFMSGTRNIYADALCCDYTNVSEYDQEIPQSITAVQLT